MIVGNLLRRSTGLSTTGAVTALSSLKEIPMKRALTLLVALALSAGAAMAQSVDAEVKKVDPGQGKLTLKHGEIKKLDMPPMTMVFRVSDKAMLDGLKAGDKVKVDVDKISGQYTVVRLSKAP